MSSLTGNEETATGGGSESLEEMESRHRKEVKALDGEKRAALKKAKALKGKKGKDAQARYIQIYYGKDDVNHHH